MTRQNRHKEGVSEAGFTLLEIMLAVTIMGFVTATVWSSFRQTYSSKEKAEYVQERTHVARLALMRMTREIEMAFLSDSENLALEDRRTMFVGTTRAQQSELIFSWFGHQRLRADAAEGDTALVKYFMSPSDEEPGIYNLMRRETRRLEAIDPEQIPGETYILCDRVVSLGFRFYDYKYEEWKEDWSTFGVDGKQYLPTHVQVVLRLLDARDEEVEYTISARIQMTERVAYRPVKS